MLMSSRYLGMHTATCGVGALLAGTVQVLRAACDGCDRACPTSWPSPVNRLSVTPDSADAMSNKVPDPCLLNLAVHASAQILQGIVPNSGDWYFLVT